MDLLACSTSTYEALAAALGLVNQVLTIRRNPMCWPVGIASVAIYVLVFRDAGLYSDMLLQFVYIALQVYGWIYWLRPPAGAKFVPIRRMSARGWSILAVVVLAGMLVLGTGMRQVPGASFPYIDAGTTMLSLSGQWLQARKVLESWLVFIAANLVYIGVYAAKSLCFTIALFSVLTVLAAFGYRGWYRAYRYERNAATA